MPRRPPASPSRSSRAPAARPARRRRARAKEEQPPRPDPSGARARPRKDPRTGRLLFPGISARAYEHPADRAALTAMRSIPGFDALLRFVFRQVGDRSLRLVYLASAVRVTPRQFPDLHALHLEACASLDIDPVPELFVAQTPLVNAGAIGVDRPFIVLYSGTLGLLDRDEMRFLLGHELGHVLSGHALYKTMLGVILRLYRMAATVPLGGAALLAITAGLLEWDRKSELSADRAGLLVAGSTEVAMRVNMKLAGGGRTDEMSLDEFLAQAKEYAAGGTVVDSLMKLLQLMGSTHPFPVLRIAELKRWVDSGGYDALLVSYPLRDGDGKASIAEEVRRSTASYREDLASSADPLVRFLQKLARQTQEAGTAVGTAFFDFFAPKGTAAPRSRKGARKQTKRKRA